MNYLRKKQYEKKQKMWSRNVGINAISFNMDEYQLNWVTSVIFLNEKPHISRIYTHIQV